MASKLNDPNFGSRDYEPNRPEDRSKLNDSNFGSKDSESNPYKQTRDTLYSAREKRDERQFQRRFEREVKSGRISKKTQNELVSRALNDFVSNVITQKRASLDASNESATQGQQQNSLISTETSFLPKQNSEPQNKSPKTNPYGIHIADLCVNGEAKKLQVVTYGGPYTE